MKSLFQLLLFLSLLAATSAEPIVKQPFEPRSQSGKPNSPLFTRLGPDHTRINYVHEIALWHPHKRLFHSSFACGSVALGDIDGDGYLDIFVAGGAGPNRLYLQAEDLSFVDVTAGLEVAGNNLWAGGAVMIDIDNDGDLDLYVCYYDAPNHLYINQLQETGELSFIESAKSFGLDLKDASLVPAFCDFDGDGDLDLYLLTHQLHRPGGRPAEPIQVEQSGSELRITGEMASYYKLDDQPDEDGKYRYRDKGRADFLLRNDDGRFVDITQRAGISTLPAVGNSVTWWDYNGDGHPDLHVGNDGFDPDFLYRNNGDGTFTDVSAEILPASPHLTAGSTLWDADNDARADLFVAGRLPRTHYRRMVSTSLSAAERARLNATPGPRQVMRNALYLATGTPHCTEVAHLAGLTATDWTWAVKAGDYDQDGRQDLFVATGAARNFNHADFPELTHARLVGHTLWDLYETAAPARPEPNLAFRNLGDLRFEETAQSWGLDFNGMTYTVAQGDLDNDGDLDLVINSLDEPLLIYRNDGTGSQAVRVRLKGTQSPAQGIGAKVFLTTSTDRQVRHLFASGGFRDADDATVHFGVGDHRRIAELRIEWPSGAVQVLRDLPTNHLLTITEESSSPPARDPAPPARFVLSDVLDDYIDDEMEFNDFEKQPLLPAALSRFGPAQAWGDVDGSGALDLYLGGSLGKSGRLLYNKTTRGSAPSFSAWAQRSFTGYEHVEDGAALLFDADGDGDQDLYVSSSGVEHEANSLAYRDRLFLNSNSGKMSDATYLLPNLREITACVTPADVDRDGDLDLFVGTRVRLHDYPTPADSFLLINQGEGQFDDATGLVAPGLSGIGLVTGAFWGDLNDDGWPDLVVSQEWGPILVFLNREGTLELSPDSGIDTLHGWWNGLACADLDNDGDLDFVASNWGSNTPYQASLESPAVLFYGDLDGSGTSHILEGFYENGICLPRRTFDSLSEVMPSLRTRIPNHHAFASSAIHQLFDLNRLKKSLILKVTEPRSGAFYNDGTGRFEFRPFPPAAQLAPAFGVALDDFTGDGIIDAFLAQNFRFFHPETGPQRGGLGVFLEGVPANGDEPSFLRPVPPAESGISFPGEGRSAAAVDVDLDGFPDLVVGLNGASPRLLLNQPRGAPAPLRLRLRGIAGNDQAIGARVTARMPGMPDQTREVAIASGFLGSAPTPLVFARPAQSPAAIDLEVRWPDGETTKTRIDGTNTFFTLPRFQPEAGNDEAPPAPETAALPPAKRNP